LALGAMSGKPTLWGSGLGFISGMLFAFYGNYYLNFRVERSKFFRTLALFVVISSCSYALNLVAKDYLNLLSWNSYPLARFVTSGCLFVVAYSLHRRFTFRHSAKNFGLAVYAIKGTRIQDLFDRVGEHCDHIHFDLVDQTVKPDAEPIETQVIVQARALWTWQPFMLHIMSHQPRRWVDACIDHVDVVLVHINGEDDIMSILAQCCIHKKQVGIVYHHSVTLAQLIPFLPHVDFVLILGVEQPGYSGQLLMQSAVEMAETLDLMSIKYGFKVIFDGGITIENVNRIPADYIISSSTVLQAEDPIRAVLSLMSGVTNARS
jgi:pentose-5-phosphate-3-epimerase